MSDISYGNSLDTIIETISKHQSDDALSILAAAFSIIENTEGRNSVDTDLHSKSTRILVEAINDRINEDKHQLEEPLRARVPFRCPYWYINLSNDVKESIEKNQTIDDKRAETGNYYFSKEYAEEACKKPDGYIPDRGGHYWFNELGNTLEFNDNGSRVDNDRYQAGNYYKTKEEAMIAMQAG